MILRNRNRDASPKVGPTKTVSQEAIFRGNTFNVDRQSWASMLVLIVISFYLVFGSIWFRVVLFVSLMVAPFMFAYYFMEVKCNWFSFDDLHRTLLKTGKRRIPYERVKGINIRETLGHLSVSIRLSRFSSIWLVHGLPAEKKDELLRSLKERFPELNIRLTRWPDLVLRLAWMLPLLYILGVSTWFSFRIYSNDPCAGVVPEQWEFTSVETAESTYRVYDMGNFILSIPGYLGEPEHKEDGLVFKDSPWRTTVAVYSRSSALPKAEGYYPLGFVLGIRDIYDLQKWAYYTRIGFLPLLIKSFFLSQTHNMKIYELEQHGLRGFLTIGIEKKRRVATIALVDKIRERELDIFIASRRPLDGTMLERIIASVRSVDSDTPHEAPKE